MQKEQRPGRPFGVTLAIIASIFLYALLPLTIVGGVLLVEDHFRRVQDTDLVLPGHTIQEGFSGGDFRGGITDAQLILQSGIALGFMLIAFLAWRGRPSYVRFIFIATVVILSLAQIYITIATSGGNDSSMSGGSADNALQSLSVVQVIMYILVPLYVIWYLNRGPARAFYRGHYLPDPEAPEK